MLAPFAGVRRFKRSGGRSSSWENCREVHIYMTWIANRYTVGPLCKSVHFQRSTSGSRKIIIFFSLIYIKHFLQNKFRRQYFQFVINKEFAAHFNIFENFKFMNWINQKKSIKDSYPGYKYIFTKYIYRYF